MHAHGKIASFAALKFLLEVGYASAFFAASSLLVSRVGTSSLMPVYLAGSLLSIALSSGFYFLIDRFPRRAVFSISFLLMGAAVVGTSAFALSRPDAEAVLWGMRILFYAVFILTELQYWLAASLMFSNRESKRYFPWLVSAGIAGGVAGGLFAGPGASLLGSAGLPLVWGVLIAASSVFFALTPFPVKKMSHVGTDILWGEIQGMGGGKTRSPFANRLTVLLAVFWIAYSFLCYGTDYVFNGYAVSMIPDADALTAYFGRVTAVACTCVLAYQTLIAPFLGERFGLDRVVFAMAALIAGVWLFFFFSPSLQAIAVTQGAIYFFLEHVAASNLNHALSLFPERIRGRIRVFTEGFGRPLGIIALFLVFAASAFRPDVALVAKVMTVSAVAFLFYPFFFRRAYAAHRVNCLGSSDHDLVISAVHAMGEKGKAEFVAPLSGLLSRTPISAVRKASILSLMDIGGESSWKAVTSFLSKADDFARADVMKAFSKNPRPEAYDHLVASLGDKDARVRATGIESLGAIGDHRAVPLVEPFLEDENRRVRVNAIIALGALDHGRKITQEVKAVIEALLHSEVEEDPRSAVFALGHLKWKDYEPTLIEFLKSPDKVMRLFAAYALALWRHPDFCGPMAELLADEDHAVAMETGKRASMIPTESYELLREAVSKLPESVRGRALGLLMH